jgi:Flp pilus assembly protein TadG
VIGSQLVTIMQRPDPTRQPSERGQSLVEFALVLPVFMLLVFGILDGGRAIVTYNDVSQATRNVARIASVTCFDTTTRCSTASGTPVGDAIAGQVALPGSVSWTVSCIDPATNAVPVNCNPGDIVRVSATTSTILVTPLISQALGPVNVASTSEAEIVQ